MFEGLAISFATDEYCACTAPPKEKDLSLPMDSFLKSFVPINFYKLESLSQMTPSHTFQEEHQFFIFLFVCYEYALERSSPPCFPVHPNSPGSAAAEILEVCSAEAASDKDFPPPRSWQKGMPVLLHQEERQKQI